jgi:hypothetical protein
VSTFRAIWILSLDTIKVARFRVLLRFAGDNIDSQRERDGILFGINGSSPSILNILRLVPECQAKPVSFPFRSLLKESFVRNVFDDKLKPLIQQATSAPKRIFNSNDDAGAVTQILSRGEG